MRNRATLVLMLLISLIVYGQKIDLGTQVRGQLFNRFIYMDGVKYPWTRAGLQAALNRVNADGGGCVIIPPNTTISLDQKVSLNAPNADMCIMGGGSSTKLTKSGSTTFPHIEINGGGLSGTPQNLAANGNEGAVSITLVSGGVAALGLAVGDYIELSDSGALFQTAKIAAIAGDVVTITDSLYESFLTANTAKVKKFSSPALRPLISGIYFDGTGNTGTDSHCVAFPYAVVDAMVRDSFFNGCTGAAVQAGDTYGLRLSNLVINKSGSANYGAVQASIASRCSFSNIAATEGGFGPQLASSNGCLMFGIASSRATVRGFKFQTASHNTLYDVAIEQPLSSGTGLTFSGASHDNIIYGLRCSGNTATAGCLSFINSGASNNTIYGAAFKGNTRDIETVAGANNNRVIGSNHTTVVDGGGGNIFDLPAAVYSTGCSGTLASSSTLYIQTMPETTCTNTGQTDQTIILSPSTHYARNLRVRLSSNVVNNTPVMMRSNFADTSLTCTVTAGTNSCSDTDPTHTVTVAGGTPLNIRVTTGASETATHMEIAFDW